MAWAHVQGAASGDFASSTTVSATFSSAVTNGDIVCGWCYWIPSQSGDPIASITDNGTPSNTYNVIIFSNNGTLNQGFGMFWSNGTLSNGATTVTVSFGSTTMTDTRMIMDEFTPPAGTTSFGVDGTGSTTAYVNVVNGGACNSGAWTTSDNGDLIYGGSTNNTSANTIGSGFTLGTTLFAENSEFEVQSSAGSANATWTNNSGSTANAYTGGFAIFALSAAATKDKQPMCLLGV